MTSSVDADGREGPGFFIKLQNLYNLQKEVDRIVEGVANGGPPFRLTEELICSLHRICMMDLIPNAGSYRQIPVEIRGSKHVCPNYIEVPNHMAAMCRYVEANWTSRDLIHLSAFCLWRLCWIHPFSNGNGRTARAVAYMVMCARHGALLPAKTTVLAEIQRTKAEFYQQLGRADAVYAVTQDIDAALSGLEQYLSQMLTAQLLAHFNED